MDVKIILSKKLNVKLKRVQNYKKKQKSVQNSSKSDWFSILSRYIAFYVPTSPFPYMTLSPLFESCNIMQSISNLTGQSFTRVILLYSSFIIKISSLQQSTSETVSRYVNKYSAVQVYFVLVAFNDPSYEFFVSLSTSLLPFYRTFSYL